MKVRVVCALAVIGALVLMTGKIGLRSDRDLPRQETEGSLFPSEDTIPETPEPQTMAQLAGEGEDFSVLLIGQDRLPGESRARSDAIVLCTWNREKGELTMTSFLRDLYLEIPGHGKNRLNAAYSLGGEELLAQTLTEAFRVSIDGSVEVDFSQFPQIIDLLGGVALELRQDEAETINEETGAQLTQGLQTLTGEQALCYARMRKLDADGDFSRTHRQRKLLSALLEQYRTIDRMGALALVKELLPLVTTDLSTPRLLKLALTLLPRLPELQLRSRTIPAAGTYSDTRIDGMAVLVADLEANRAILADAPES